MINRSMIITSTDVYCNALSNFVCGDIKICILSRALIILLLWQSSTKPCIEASCCQFCDILPQIKTLQVLVQQLLQNTVESRYLKLRYLSLILRVRCIYLNQNYILFAFSNNNLAWGLFYPFKLPEVQINLLFE